MKTVLHDNTDEYITDDVNVRNGLLFIPDISGFTELVRTTDVLTGKQITYELLSAVIAQNNLRLRIAEVEGDAVLYYRYGTPPTLCELFKQYETMTKAFDKKLAELEKRFSTPLNLSLKVIAHYGPMAEFKIGHFKKLYGEVVIEAHRLLKNSITADSYLLLTDSLFEIMEVGELDIEHLLKQGIRSEKLCEVYGGLRNINFRYFDFTERRALKNVA